MISTDRPQPSVNTYVSEHPKNNFYTPHEYTSVPLQKISQTHSNSKPKQTEIRATLPLSILPSVEFNETSNKKDPKLQESFQTKAILNGHSKTQSENDINKPQSANLIVSSSSSSASFKLSEFKREFKRSSFDLNLFGTGLGLELNSKQEKLIRKGDEVEIGKKIESSKNKSDSDKQLSIKGILKETNDTLGDTKLPKDLLFKESSKKSMDANSSQENISQKKQEKSGKVNLLSELKNGLKYQTRKIIEEKKSLREEDEGNDERGLVSNASLASSNSSEITASSSSQGVSVSDSSSSSTTSTSTTTNTTSTSPASSSSSVTNSSSNSSSSATGSSSESMDTSLGCLEKNANVSLIANVGFNEKNGSCISGIIGSMGKLQANILNNSMSEAINSKTTTASIYPSLTPSSNTFDSTSNNVNIEKNLHKNGVRASTPNCKSNNSTTNNSSWQNILNNHSTIRTDPTDSNTPSSLTSKNLMASEFVQMNKRKNILTFNPFQNFLLKPRENENGDDLVEKSKLEKFVKKSDCFRKRDDTRSEPKIILSNQKKAYNTGNEFFENYGFA